MEFIYEAFGQLWATATAVALLGSTTYCWRLGSRATPCEFDGGLCYQKRKAACRLSCLPLFSVFSQSIRENACAVIVCAYTDRHDDREINARVVTCVARWLIVCTCKWTYVGGTRGISFLSAGLWVFSALACAVSKVLPGESECLLFQRRGNVNYRKSANNNNKKIVWR